MQEPRSLSDKLHLDLPLLFGLIVLCAIGLVVLYSASGENSQLVFKQAMRMAFAFLVLFLIAQVKPTHLLYWTPWLYVFGVLMLIAVLLFGEVAQGAQRWLRLGPANLQPSEFAKITIPLMVGYYLAERALPPRLSRVAIAGVLVMIPTLLIARQPDLGTAILIASAGVIALFLAGLSWRLITVLGIVGAACLPALWFVMHDYQRRRVLMFIDPEQDPLGAGYHIIQSKIAIGSGGLYGKGWLNGTQSQLEFLPERSTDFILSVFSEEFGLLGVATLLAAYLFVVLRGLYIAANAQDSFGRIVAGSLVLTFFVYIFVNAGMVSGLLPVVGVPLPLISYGGSSIVTLMAAFGLIMSIHTHRRLLSD